MGLTRQEVESVAHLARLELSAPMAEKMSGQLSAVLDYIAKLNELETKDVEPLSHAGGLSNVFRADEPRPSLSNAEALKNAPDQADGFFRVPRVIE